MNEEIDKEKINEDIREQRGSLETQKKIQELERKFGQLQDEIRYPEVNRKIDEIMKRLFFGEELNEVYTSAPTYIPKTFPQQFCFYKVGAERRLYIYIDGAWAYEILT